MLPPSLLAPDFLSALQSLMPRGRAWPKDPSATQWKALAGLAPIYERSTARANYLLTDASPKFTLELLPEWEKSLGLPDPCAGSSPTIQQRQAQVFARFVNNGGQSPGYFISHVALLGFTITITEYAPFRASVNRAGDPLTNGDWPNTWTVHGPLAGAIQFFRAGESSAGEPLSTFGNAELQCLLGEIAPAHTLVQFVFT